jgi:hypothetical protein
MAQQPKKPRLLDLISLVSVHVFVLCMRFFVLFSVTLEPTSRQSGIKESKKQGTEFSYHLPFCFTVMSSGRV